MRSDTRSNVYGGRAHGRSGARMRTLGSYLVVQLPARERFVRCLGEKTAWSPHPPSPINHALSSYVCIICSLFICCGVISAWLESSNFR